MLEGACFSLLDGSVFRSIRSVIVFLWFSLMGMLCAAWCHYCNNQNQHDSKSKKNPHASHAYGRDFICSFQDNVPKRKALCSCKQLKWPSVRCNSLNDDGVCHRLYVSWCASPARPSEDCLNQADVSSFFPASDWRRNAIQSCATRPPLQGTNVWGATASTPVVLWGTVTSTAVDNYVYLGGNADKNPGWSKNILDPSISAKTVHELFHHTVDSSADLLAVVCKGSRAQQTRQPGSVLTGSDCFCFLWQRKEYWGLGIPSSPLLTKPLLPAHIEPLK